MTAYSDDLTTTPEADRLIADIIQQLDTLAGTIDQFNGVATGRQALMGKALHYSIVQVHKFATHEVQESAKRHHEAINKRLGEYSLEIDGDEIVPDGSEHGRYIQVKLKDTDHG